MAYSITQLINEYNAQNANMLANSVIKTAGVLAYGTYYTANKQLAHTYNVFSTLPTAGIRSLGDGIAASTTSGSSTTVNMSLFTVTGQWDAAFVGNDLNAFMLKNAPRYVQSLTQQMQKSIIYGTNATFGNASYTGTGWHSLISSSAATQRQALSTGSSQTGATSIFAVRFAPVEDTDGVALVTDPMTYGGLFYLNEGWDKPAIIAGNTGPYEGYTLMYQSNMVGLTPSTNCVAGIVGITSALTPTEAQVDAMLDAVKADQNTVIFCNRTGKGVLSRLGKSGALYMMPNDFGYSNQIATWNGVPIVLTDNISSAQTSALYGY